MSDQKLPGILKIFYMTGLRYLPVVASLKDGQADQADDLTGALVGFVSRNKLDLEMADLERAYRSYSVVPTSVMINGELPADLITHVTAVERLPVLNESGEKIKEWEPAEVLRAIARFREKIGQKHETVSSEPPVPVAKPLDREKGSAWLTKLILAEIPFPLLATDLEGQTLFYNTLFTDKILVKPHLKNSIRLSEKYFINLTRELLANAYSGESFSASRDNMQLKCRLTDLNLNVTICSLPAGEGLAGYLYIFQNPQESPLFDEVSRMMEGGMSLPDALEEIEAGVIHFALVKKKQNVSHTAEFLNMRRTTLQNRIKKLDLSSRYQRQVNEPVPRRKKQVSSADPDAISPEHYEN